jgi:hypothetical protein
VGLCLFPDDGDVETQDVSWSYSHFDEVRRFLSQAEGFELSDMCGFGGDRPWSEISTPLAPLLDHPDDHGELSVAECESVLPRLEEIIGQQATNEPDERLLRRMEDLQVLAAVLRICAEKNVALLFG